MRKRNVHIQFWLSEAEAELLAEKVRRTGMTREAYLRHLVHGEIPRDAPGPDYYRLMNALYELEERGYSLAETAKAMELPIAKSYAGTAKAVSDAVRQIEQAVLLPSPITDLPPDRDREAAYQHEMVSK